MGSPKMLRLELLNVKADLERELEDFRPQLFEVRPLGAPGTGAARRAQRLTRGTLRCTRTLECVRGRRGAREASHGV